MDARVQLRAVAAELVVRVRELRLLSQRSAVLGRRAAEARDEAGRARGLAQELVSVARAVSRSRRDFLVRCAWCGRLQLAPGGPWLSPSTPMLADDALALADATTHGICPDCHERVQHAADAERAQRDGRSPRPAA